MCNSANWQRSRCGSVQGEIVLGVASVFAFLWAAGAFVQDAGKQPTKEKPLVLLCNASIVGGDDPKDHSASWVSTIQPKVQSDSLGDWTVYVHRVIEDETEVPLSIRFKTATNSSTLQLFYSKATETWQGTEVPWLMELGAHGVKLSQTSHNYSKVYAQFQAFKDDSSIRNADLLISTALSYVEADNVIQASRGPRDGLPANRFRHALLYGRNRILEFFAAVEEKFPGRVNEAVRSLKGEQQGIVRSKLRLPPATDHSHTIEIRQELEITKNRLWSFSDPEFCHRNRGFVNSTIEGMVGTKVDPGVIFCDEASVNRKSTVLISNTNRLSRLAGLAGFVRMLESGKGSDLPNSARTLLSRTIEDGIRRGDPLVALVLAEVNYFAMQSRLNIVLNVEARGLFDCNRELKYEINGSGETLLTVGKIVKEGEDWRFVPAAYPGNEGN